MKRSFVFFLFPVMALIAACTGPKDGEYRVDIFSTNDVHGHYFDSVYVGDRTQLSLANVSTYIKGERNALGEDNMLLIDVGDILQGDNAAYYYNYVDTVSEHVYVKAAGYLKYDLAVVGNHDIETGHPVYDRMSRELPMPFLGGNAIDEATGEPYFPEYAILKRGGLKIAVVGLTNPNVDQWLSKSLWSGIEFEPILPYCQELVDKVIAAEHPHIVIVAMHSGTGDGNLNTENQGLAALCTLEGVDFVFCAHDHSSRIIEEYRNVDGKDSLVSIMINGGSHCREIGHATVTVKIEDGKIVSKKLSAELVPMDGVAPDKDYLEYLRPEYEAVKAFTVKEVGRLTVDIATLDAMKGRAAYTDLLHTLQLSCGPAEISFAAPLTYDGHIPAGMLDFQDLFTIYPFENQLFVVKMTGREIKDALEFSYSKWVNTLSVNEAARLIKGNAAPGLHALAIDEKPDKRTGAEYYSFINRTYNFDSAAGIDYTVDLTKPYGEKVDIISMADGSAFSLDSTYNVAMTSYRASGGGGILAAAGINTAAIDERVVERYPEIRNILYDYLKINGVLSAENISDEAVLGDWHFLPEGIDKAIGRDFLLLMQH